MFGRSPHDSAMLMLHQGALGDFLLTLPVVAALRTTLSRPQVIAIASAASARLMAGRGVIDRHMSPESVGLHTLFGEDGGALDPRLQSLLHLTAPVVLNFLSDADHAIHRRLAETMPRGRVISVDPRPPIDAEHPRHITQCWTDAIRAQGISIGEAAPVRVDRASDTSREETSKQRPIVIHPGSGGRGKCWPLKRFLQLADGLNEYAIDWMLGPAELEREPEMHALLKQRVVEHGGRLIVEEDLQCAADHVARAKLYVGNDAGMTHLAAVLGVSTVALFGTTDPRVWRPFGEHVHAIYEEAGAADPWPSVERVISACKELLAQVDLRS